MQNTKKLTKLSLFAAIILMLAYTPFIGYIPLGFTRATIIHIPVILGSILLGPAEGAILGTLFGLTSLFNNTFNPTVTSFVFSPFYSVGGISGNFLSLVICLVPRILVGVFPYYVFKWMKKICRLDAVALGCAGIIGSLTNTLLVMNMIYLFFGSSFASVNHIAENALYFFILSIICINGLPEAIVACIITMAVGLALMRSKYYRPDELKLDEPKLKP